jgi:hypothetical protein
MTGNHRPLNEHTNDNQSTGVIMGRDGSVGIATGYGLDSPGIESRWGRQLTHIFRPACGPPSLLYSGYRVLPGGKAAGAWC